MNKYANVRSKKIFNKFIYIKIAFIYFVSFVNIILLLDFIFIHFLSIKIDFFLCLFNICFLFFLRFITYTPKYSIELKGGYYNLYKERIFQLQLNMEMLHLRAQKNNFFELLDPNKMENANTFDWYYNEIYIGTYNTKDFYL